MKDNFQSKKSIKIKKTSIRDVALEAGVSISTVSRVIRKYKNVPKETEERVNLAIKKLNYIPNLAAQCLTEGSLKNIGVVLTTSAENAFVNPFYSEVMSGIGHVTQQHGYYVQLLSFYDVETEKTECLKLIRSGRVDGLIVLNARVYDSLLCELSENDYKFVISGRVEDVINNKDVYCVNTDNINDSFKITKHLLDLGHKKIAMINGPREYTVNEDRYAGFRRALLYSGIEYDEELEIQGGYTIQYAKTAVKEKLLIRPDITAIFAKDDIKAIAAIQAIKEMGKRVPEDISVVGYNDYAVSTIIEPNLTTIRVPIFELGKKLAEIMIKLLQGEKVEEQLTVLPTELIIRDSTCVVNSDS